MTKTNNLLLIEDDRAYAMLIRNMLTDPSVGPFRVEWVASLSGSLERLSKGGIEGILADLFLPDSQGIPTLDSLLLAAPCVPSLVLSDPNDEGNRFAGRAVRRARLSPKEFPQPLHIIADRAEHDRPQVRRRKLVRRKGTRPSHA